MRTDSGGANGCVLLRHPARLSRLVEVEKVGVHSAREMCTAIAVIGTQSPGKSLAMAGVLDDCVQRHGWSGRVSVTAAGFGSGAGLADPEDIDVINALGFDVIHPSCPSLDDATAVVDEAACLVVSSEAEADLLLQWPIADGKRVLAFADFFKGAESLFGSPQTELAQFVENLEQAVQELLRSLVAVPA